MSNSNSNKEKNKEHNKVKELNKELKGLKKFFTEERDIYEHNILVEKLNNFAIEMSENGTYFTLLNNFKSELEKISIQNEPESNKQTIITYIEKLCKDFGELKHKSKTITDLKTKVDTIEKFLIDFKKSINAIHIKIQDLLIIYGTENKNLQEGINKLKSKHQIEKLKIYQSELNNMLKFENINSDVTKLINEIEDILTPIPESSNTQSLSNTQPQTQSITILLSSIEDSIKELYSKIEYTIICDFIKLLSLELPEQSTFQLGNIENKEKEEIEKQMSEFKEKQKDEPSQQQAQAQPILTTEEKLELFNTIQKLIMEYNLKIHLLNKAIIPKHTELIDLAKEKLSYDESKIKELYNAIEDINIQNNLLDLDKINKKLETELFESSGNNSKYVETIKALFNLINENPTINNIAHICAIYKDLDEKQKESLKENIDKLISTINSKIQETNDTEELRNYSEIIEHLNKCGIINNEIYDKFINSLNEKIEQSTHLSENEVMNFNEYYNSKYGEEYIRNTLINEKEISETLYTLYKHIKSNGSNINDNIKDIIETRNNTTQIIDKFKNVLKDEIDTFGKFKEKIGGFKYKDTNDKEKTIDEDMYNRIIAYINITLKPDSFKTEDTSGYTRLNNYFNNSIETFVKITSSAPQNSTQNSTQNDKELIFIKKILDINTYVKLITKIIKEIMFEVFNREAKIYIKLVHPPSISSTENTHNTHIELDGCEKSFCDSEKIKFINNDTTTIEFGPYDNVIGMKESGTGVESNLPNSCYFKIKDTDCMQKRPYDSSNPNEPNNDKKFNVYNDLSEINDFIKKYKDETEERNISLFGYGFSGSGKTYSFFNSQKGNLGIFYQILDKYNVQDITIDEHYGSYNPLAINDKVIPKEIQYKILEGTSGENLSAYQDKNVYYIDEENDDLVLRKNTDVITNFTSTASWNNTKPKKPIFYCGSYKNSDEMIDIINFIQLLRWKNHTIKRTKNNKESSRSILRVKIKVGKNIFINIYDLPGTENPLNIFKNRFGDGHIKNWVYKTQDILNQERKKEVEKTTYESKLLEDDRQTYQYFLRLFFMFMSNHVWKNIKLTKLNPKTKPYFKTYENKYIYFDGDFSDNDIKEYVENKDIYDKTWTKTQNKQMEEIYPNYPKVKHKKTYYERIKKINQWNIFNNLLITDKTFKNITNDTQFKPKDSVNMVESLRAISNENFPILDEQEESNKIKITLLFMVEMMELFCEGLYINNFLSNFLKTIKERNTGISEKSITQVIKIPDNINDANRSFDFILENNKDILQSHKPTEKRLKKYNQFTIINGIQNDSMDTLLEDIKNSYIYIIGHIRTDMKTNEDSIYGNLNTLYFTDIMNYKNNYREDKPVINNNIKDTLSTLNLENLQQQQSAPRRGGSRKLSKSKRERLRLKLRQKIKKNKQKKQQKINK